MTWTFNPNAYAPVVAELLRDDRLPALGPGKPNTQARLLLDSLAIESLFAAQTIRDADLARCCLSALWLHHDFLDESHQISQDIDTTSGSCWHAIMHRREPDSGNSKYWWRRAGEHPFLDLLRKESAGFGYAYSKPPAFVDFCEQTRGTGSDGEALARRIQLLEWRILFDWCWRQSL